MRVFVTGASGFVGSAVVGELVAHGHQVRGLVRSEDGAKALETAGAEAVRGVLEDQDGLARAAASADAVIHTAFNHDFSRFAENCDLDRRAIEALGAGLEGSGKPLLVTSGTARLAPGRLALETDPPREGVDGYPRVSETAAAELVAKGVHASVVRLAPSTHGAGDHGFVPLLIDIARRTGVSAYPGEGRNRWSGVHRHDAAKVYRLAIERGIGGERYHAVAEEGVPFREIAAAIGRGLGLPVESRPPEHFGWFAMFAGMDAATSSDWTRQTLGWSPTGPGLIADIETAGYFGP
ncbi:SDR family oxidoreductase [Caulobacter sp. BK020]|uniref:SDR family oxidoreductase n=1 Tax=Caulobacter sp. BK020 TaxID=2512117 RepID=UPI00104C9800|nr:SDR family oxidoreductase [Caulobacter sp. BK020]TCS10109.1 nucleoside-diphosphate-sugar epimerase [Caulobacter sp. BK020]